jgi:acyl-coenzyme A synthetase/AMP-(fatty) acid ligase
MGPWILFQLVNKGTIAIYNGVSTTFGFMQFVQDAKVTMLGVVPSIVKAWKNVTEKQTALLKEKAKKDADTRERSGSGKTWFVGLFYVICYVTV